MSNVRPWFRLSSIARPTSQGSSDPPPPPRQTPARPVVVRPPPTKQPSPSSPPRQQTPPPPPPQDRSPYHSPSSRHTSPPTPTKSKSPLTPPPSPKEVHEALPPRKAPPPKVLSPYTHLPPSHELHSGRETTQKNILTAVKTSQLHEPKHHDHQGNNNKNKNTSENVMRTRVITIAGENKGAVMEIIQSPSSNKTREGTHSSVNGRRVQSSSSSDEGEGKKETTKNHNNNGNNMKLPMKAFMNSNVQMINNSIVYNSAVAHHDPGIHLKIYKKPGSANGFHVKDYGNNGGGYTN